MIVFRLRFKWFFIILIYVDLPAPSNVRATVLSHCSVEVTWDELFDATEYVISYSTTKEHITCGNVIVKGASTTRYTFNNLEENTPYIITVQATASDSRKSAVSSELSLVAHAAGKSQTYVHYKINIYERELCATPQFLVHHRIILRQ